MENQEVYNIEKGVKEVVITHRAGLDEERPHNVTILGNIDSVFNWLVKRLDIDVLFAGNRVNQSVSHVIINRDKMSIGLVFNETDPLKMGEIIGELEEHPEFKKWNINTGENWNHDELAEFIKMNRSSFKSKQEAIKLSAELKTLKIKVDKEVEASSDNRGNVKVMLAQKVVDSSIPKSFRLTVPVFKGQEKQEFEVEIYVNPNNYQVTLISPDAADIISELRDSVIDEQKRNIEDIAPDLVIIER